MPESLCLQFHSQSFFVVNMAWKAAIVLFATAACVAAKCSSKVSSDSPEEAVGQITLANNAFSMDLYKLLRSSPGNLIVSPMSAFLVLSMAWEGAGGATANQMQTVLHLPTDRNLINQGFEAFIASFQTEPDMILRLANSVYLQTGADIKTAFRDIVVNVFHSQTQELDFRNEPDQSRDVINRWVEEITNNTIVDLIKILDPETLMVLVNAIYFKGTWQYAFNTADTKTKIFHTTPTTQVNVSMMQQTANFGTLELPELNARVLQLLYHGDAVKMFVVLPNAIDGLPNVENNIALLNFTNIEQNLVYRQTHLEMPKGKMESEFELAEPLQRLGIVDAFTNRANFSGITDLGVLVSRVVQKAFLEVTETGTVAAAATGVIVRPTSVVIASTTFIIDHPYLIFLVGTNGKIMFIGRVLQPES